MFNIPSNILEELKEKMKISEGTLSFKYTSNDLLNPETLWWVIFENIAWWHIFRLVRTDGLSLDFYYSSPWTGTRLASIDLSKIGSESTSFLVIFTWSPEKIQLHIWPLNPRWELLSVEWKKANFELRIWESWDIYSVGDEGVNVMWLKVFQNWKKELQSTAINSWNETKQAIEILKTGQSKEWYIYETIQTNIIISTLVTWSEVYCKRRALELEQEWIMPNLGNYYTPEKLSEYEANAQKKWVKLFNFIVEGKTSFQNYERCNEFYNKIYWIKFWELIWIKNTDLEELQKFIWFRHKIVHEESILLWMLNQESVPPAEPIFPNKALSNKAIEIFDIFIQSLHQATIELRKEN